MKPHRILKSFPGSQDGIHKSEFKEGQTEKLSASLAAIVVPLGWAEPVEGEVDETGQVYLDENPIDPELRDTKVVSPQERKPLRFRKK